MSSRVNRSIGKAPKEVKNKDFLSIFFYKNPISQYVKTRFKAGDKVRISKYDIPFRKGYKSQFTSEIFEIVKIATYKLQHTTSRESRVMKYYENFMNKNSQSVSFSDELFYGRAGFQRVF